MNTHGVDVRFGAGGIVDKLADQVRDLPEHVDLFDEPFGLVRLLLFDEVHVQQGVDLGVAGGGGLAVLEAGRLPAKLERRGGVIVGLGVLDRVDVGDVGAADDAGPAGRDGDEFVADDDRTNVDRLGAVLRRRGKLHHDERDGLFAFFADRLEVGKVPVGGEQVGPEPLDRVDKDAAGAVEVLDVVADADDAAHVAARPDAVDRVAVSAGGIVGRVAARRGFAAQLTEIGEAAAGTVTDLEAVGDALVLDRDLDVLVVLGLDRVLVAVGRVHRDRDLVRLARPLVRLDFEVGHADRLPDVGVGLGVA